LVAALVITTASVFHFVIVGCRQRRWPLVLAPLLVLLHPLLQPVFLERLDTELNYRWRDEVVTQHLVGKSEGDVVGALGRPTGARPYGTGKLWEYKPLPFYWFGSCGQLFFVNGRVQAYDANDD
jgi:hypothetical protein